VHVLTNMVSEEGGDARTIRLDQNNGAHGGIVRQLEVSVG
jgi:hypothetical protein